MNSGDQVQIRRRNRLRHHYTMTSNVILFGYRQLTDAEKITYEVVDSFDWSDGAGLRKGYAYPSLARVAVMRGSDVRTIRRHLAALERAGLITRERRAGRPSLLWIEEPSREEAERYLSTIAMGPDTDVRGTPDTDVRPYKEDEEQERQNHVNADDGLTAAERKAKSAWLAQEMLNVLHDERSTAFYRKVAQSVPQHRVFEALSEVRLADREGRVRTSKGALFVALIRQHMATTRKEKATTE